MSKHPVLHIGTLSLWSDREDCSSDTPTLHTVVGVIVGDPDLSDYRRQYLKSVWTTLLLVDGWLIHKFLNSLVVDIRVRCVLQSKDKIDLHKNTNPLLHPQHSSPPQGGRWEACIVSQYSLKKWKRLKGNNRARTSKSYFSHLRPLRTWVDVVSSGSQQCECRMKVPTHRLM